MPISSSLGDPADGSRQQSDCWILRPAERSCDLGLMSTTRFSSAPMTTCWSGDTAKTPDRLLLYWTPSRKNLPHTDGNPLSPENMAGPGRRFDQVYPASRREISPFHRMPECMVCMECDLNPILRMKKGCFNEGGSIPYREEWTISEILATKLGIFRGSKPLPMSGPKCRCCQKRCFHHNLQRL
jgi:hypothetical protein